MNGLKEVRIVEGESEVATEKVVQGRGMFNTVSRINIGSILKKHT